MLPPATASGNADSGSWRDGPDGVLILKGEGINSGTKLEEADIKDVDELVRIVTDKVMAALATR